MSYRIVEGSKGDIVTGKESQSQATSRTTSTPAATCTLDIISHSSAQTQRLGMRLGELLRGGELILLEGQLGTGKTTFTQGIARGMGLDEVISSPTFTLLKEYAGSPLPFSETKQARDQSPVKKETQPKRPSEPVPLGPALYHFDLYRLDDPAEMFDLGFEDYFFGAGVSVVEWANKAETLWPHDHLRLRLKVLSETKRNLLFTGFGVSYCLLLQQFQKNTYATISS
jgi:tRNA threonylcarbamoyladenosine biosynthesis protein TsaE